MQVGDYLQDAEAIGLNVRCVIWTNNNISASELLHQVPDAVTSATIAEVQQQRSTKSDVDSAPEETDVIAQKV